jgi:hypothetical protein
VSRKAEVKSPAGTEGDAKWSDTTDQSEAYEDCENRLNRPYTFVVLALLILIKSPVMILRTTTDLFPSIIIPRTSGRGSPGARS